MNDDDLDRMLEEVGAAPVPPPDELTVARIEHRLRDLHATGTRRPIAVWPVLAGAAAAVLAVVLVVGGPSSPTPVDTAGTGQDLAPVTSAPTTTLAPPDEDVGERDDPDPAGDDERPGDDSGAGVPPDGDGTPSTTVPPEAAPEPDPDGSTPGGGPTTTAVTRPTDRPADTTTTTSPSKDEVRRIDAAAMWKDGRAVVVWRAPDGDGPAYWRVVRYVRIGDAWREEVVADRLAAAERRAIDDPPERGDVFYVVSGHRRDGHVVARSDRVALKR